MEKDISNDLVRTHLIFDDNYSTTTMPAAVTLSKVEQHLYSQVVWCIWHEKRSWKHQHKPYQVPLRWWAGRPALSHDILMTSLVMQWLPISQNMLPFSFEFSWPVWRKVFASRLTSDVRIFFHKASNFRSIWLLIPQIDCLNFEWEQKRRYSHVFVLCSHKHMIFWN
jgi:hypothetical protein